jgi:hypothetical protein
VILPISGDKGTSQFLTISWDSLISLEINLPEFSSRWKFSEYVFTEKLKFV